MQDVRDNKLFSNLSVIGGGLLVLIIIGAIVYFSLQKNGYFLNKQNKDKNFITSVKYVCDEEKTLTVDFFEMKTEVATSTDMQDTELPPVPTGYVFIKLDDGRNFNLNQTISADGARYADKNESFVFWSKGVDAMILEFDNERKYRGCKKYDPTENGYKNLTTYTDSNFNFNVKYPKGYTLNNKYEYTLLGPGKSINGVKFTIPKNYTYGNNLSNDSYMSIENIPNSKSCSASSFLSNGVAQNISENGSDYSFASSSDAGAGNRYEEYVYAFPKNDSCFAARYFIHYSVLENYDPGTIGAFNKDNLLKGFDAIRDSLNFAN